LRNFKNTNKIIRF
jgi:synaptotagmin-1